VRGFSPWCESARALVLFGGVCEAFLEERPERVADEMLEAVAERPFRLVELEGRFAAVVIDKARVRGYVVTGATDTTSLWCADGRGGHAVASRAVPMLRLLERDPELDPAGAGLFLCFGYLAGRGSLFRHVRRVPTRHLGEFVVGRAPRWRKYVTVPEWLGEGPARGHDDAVRFLADRLCERVAWEVAHSADPVLSLSGGEDSRSLAAAIPTGGYRVDAYSAGPADSADVRLARRAAAAAGLPHIAPGLGREAVLQAEGCVDTCRRWSSLSEGMETVRHLLAVPDVFLAERPCLGGRTAQVLHGHAGGVHKGFYGRDRLTGLDRPGRLSDLRWILRRAADADLLAAAAAQADLAAHLEDFAAEMHGAGLSLGVWLDVWYWQNRCLHWGSDMFSAKDPLGWHWAPLLDREMVRCSLGYAGPRVRRERILSDVVRLLAPALARIPYTGGFRTDAARRRARLGSFAGALGLRTLARRGRVLLALPRPIPPHPALAAFWREVFADTSDLEGVVRPAVIERLQRTGPSSEFLWNAATVLLAVQGARAFNPDAR
jgi:hypothetical protein